MNKKQIQLYTENLLRLATAIQVVGGTVRILEDLDNIELIETLSRNGIKLSVSFIPHIGD